MSGGKTKSMKLDLINSRPSILPDRGPRVYDSLEGEYIRKPQLPAKEVFKASFRSKQLKTDYLRKNEKIPDRFNLAVIDNSGNFVEMDQTLHPKSSKSLVMRPEKGETELPLTDLLSKPEYNSTFLDAIRDGVYEIREDNMKQRLEGGRLPGALWPITGRKFVPHWNPLGPGDYDVYRDDLTMHGPMPMRGGQFNTQPSGREYEEELDPEFLPMKERKRYKIREQHILSKSMSQTASQFHSNCLEEKSPHRGIGMEGSGVIKFGGVSDRFNDSLYRQEKYVKTSGMLLDHNYDHHLVKKIPFSFETHEPTKNASGFSKKASAATEGGDVDVDVGHLYSLQHASMTSPIKYSSAFRSHAKVGMEIPVPTSGIGGGPGAFPGSEQPSVVIKDPHLQSRPFKQERKFYVRKAAPPLTQPYPKFSEMHRSGPMLEVGKTDGKNEWMENLVKEKMTKIYPRLAKKKFPPKPRPQPPRKGKIK